MIIVWSSKTSHPRQTSCQATGESTIEGAASAPCAQYKNANLESSSSKNDTEPGEQAITRNFLLPLGRVQKGNVENSSF